MLMWRRRRIGVSCSVRRRTLRQAWWRSRSGDAGMSCARHAPWQKANKNHSDGSQVDASCPQRHAEVGIARMTEEKLEDLPVTR